MNTIIFKKVSILSTVVLALVAGFMAGCRDEFESVNENEVNAISWQNERSNSWQEQLEAVLNDEHQKISSQGLRLLKYEKSNDVPVSWIKSNINEDLLIPVYLDQDNINALQLLCVTDHKFDRSDYLHRKSDLIDKFNEEDLQVVKLLWNLDGGTDFSSYCIVTEKDSNEIIYDDVLSNIRYVKLERTSEITQLRIPRLKSGNEGNGVTLPYTFHTPTYSIVGFWGDYKAIAYGSITINGTSSMSSHTESVHFDAQSGYSADADIIVTDFQSIYCDFSWAVMVSTTANLSISWNGVSFSIPGGSSGSKGSQRVAL
jgi:hypothetical protein